MGALNYRPVGLNLPVTFFFLVSTTMRGEEQYAAISECVLAEKTGEQLQTVIEQIYPSGDLT